MKARIVFSMATFAASTAAGADIIYDTFIRGGGSGAWAAHEPDQGETGSADESPTGNEFASKIGQRIAFGGPRRHVTRFDVTFLEFPTTSPPQDTTLDATLEIWEADGDLPGALIWSGDASTTLTNTLFDKTGVARFEPHITLPDSIFASVSYANIVQQEPVFSGVSGSNTSIPLVLPAPPVLFFEPSSESWIDIGFPSSIPFLTMRVEAIPGPATLLPLASLGLIASRRTRKEGPVSA